MGSGPLKSRVKTIPVIDGNGDELTLYEVQERGALFGLLRRTRLVLPSGEAVIKARDGFVVVATGEALERIKKR